MDNPVISPRIDVVMAQSQPRPTPPPASVPFSQVLAAGAQSIVQGADQAASVLPGAPLMALALRGATASASPPSSAPIVNPIVGGSSTSPAPSSGATSSGSSLVSSTSAEGPTTSGSTASSLSSLLGGSSSSSDPSLDSVMAQSQQMNLYYLQVQEQENAQDRAYSAYSNVLKSQHDTVMTSVGNIR